MTLSKALEFRRFAQISVDGGQPLPRFVPGVNLQFHRVEELLSSRHSICASKLGKHLVADSKSSSIQCAMSCIVSHEISTALATRNFKKRYSRSIRILAKHGPKSRMLSNDVQLKQVLKQKRLKLLGHIIKGSLDEKLPSYEVLKMLRE